MFPINHVALVIIVLASIVSGFLLLLRLGKRKEKWPPGPRGLPLLGNLLKIQHPPHKTFSRWAMKYGPIIRVDLGKIRIVVISDHDLLHEMFFSPHFSGRVDNAHLYGLLLSRDGRRLGILSTEGTDWEKTRRFTSCKLNDSGFSGQQHMVEDAIMGEVEELMSNLAAHCSANPVSGLRQLFQVAVCNVLWTVLAGHRFAYGDVALLEMIEKATTVLGQMIESNTNFSQSLHLLLKRKAFPRGSDNRLAMTVGELAAFIKTMVDKHKEAFAFAPGTERDYIDAFLTKVSTTRNVLSIFHNRHENHLQAVLMDLFMVGTDTTASALCWAMLYLVKFPNTKERLQQEIDGVVGHDRRVGLLDKQRMPYARAVVAETLRLSSILPLGFPHRALRDTEFREYFIPKDTIIMANLHFIHHNPNVWGDPDVFRPERFLSQDGTSFLKHPALLPFSTGRRQCPCDGMADDVIFLFVTSIFQRFCVEWDHNGPNNGLDSADIGFAGAPKAFSVLLKDRLQL